MPWIPYVPLINRDQMELGDPEKKKARHKSSHEIRQGKFFFSFPFKMSQLETKRQEKKTGEGTK